MIYSAAVSNWFCCFCVLSLLWMCGNEEGGMSLYSPPIAVMCKSVKVWIFLMLRVHTYGPQRAGQVCYSLYILVLAE
jgi:hypothetical protein